jgi:O-antigen ligase
LAFACAASLVGGKLFPLSYGGKFSEVHFLPDMAKAWYLFWPCILVIGLKRLRDPERVFVFNAWILTFAALSVVGIIQHYTGWPREQPIPGEREHYHATLFLGHHLSVASIFIFPFFASLDQAFYRFKKTPNKPRVGKKNVPEIAFEKTYPTLYLIAAALGFITLFLTYSRTLWVALPIGVLIWAIWVAPRRFLPYVGFSIVGIALALSQYPPIKRRLAEGMGIGDRKELWIANFDFFKQRLLTGVGWHHNQELSAYYLMNKYHTADVFNGHAHNNFLDMLGGLGLLGAMAWLGWCLWVFWITLPHTTRKASLSFSKGLICAWIVFQLNGLTQVNFWEGKVQHQMAWAIAWALSWYP